VKLKADDVIGCSFNRTKSATTLTFSVNGVVVADPVKFSSEGDVFPVFQTQISGVEITANFGSSPFFYPPADPPPSESAASESLADLSGLPFADVSEMALETPEKLDMSLDLNVVPSPSPQKQAPKNVQPVEKVKSCQGSPQSVQPRASLIELPLSYNTMHGSLAVSIGEDEEEEEDMTTKLIKAWESQVLPKIKSRFRNSAERQNGWEQIKGALLFGMPEMARITIEGLYEENGGMPADLHLPTIDDLKATANTLGANQIKKGMRVLIQSVPARTDYEVPGMELTRNKVGVVAAVDVKKSIAQVDVYLDDEACLVGFWYPVSVLQKALQHSVDIETSSSGADEHRELLLWESKLTRLYCCNIALQLIDHDLQGTELLAKLISPVDALRVRAFNHRRYPIPGDCFVRSLSPSVFYEWTRNVQCSFKQHFFQLWQAAQQSGTTESFINDVFQCLHDPAAFGYVELSVDSGRKQFNLLFEGCSYIVVSPQAKKQGSCRVLAKPASAKDGPWARFYIGKNANGPQYATYPSSSPGVDPLPYIVLPTAKAHVRTTGQDSSPNCTILAHGVPSDFPLALMLIEFLTASDSGVSPAALQALSQALMTMLKSLLLPPFIRELLLHSLALLLRRLGADFDGAESIVAILSEELVAVRDFAQQSNSSQFTRFPSYFQALFDAVMAFWEIKRAGPEEQREKQGVAAKEVVASDAAARPQLNASEAWMQNAKRLLIYLRVLLSRNLQPCVEQDSCRLPQSLLRAAWARCTQSNAEQRFVVVQGLPVSMPCSELRRILSSAANAVGGLNTSEIYLPVNGDGAVVGHAVVELHTAQNAGLFQAALSSRQEFKAVKPQPKIACVPINYVELLASTHAQEPKPQSEGSEASPFQICSEFIRTHLGATGDLKAPVINALAQLVLLSHSEFCAEAKDTWDGALLSFPDIVTCVPLDASNPGLGVSTNRYVLTFLRQLGYDTDSRIGSVFEKYAPQQDRDALSFRGLVQFVQDQATEAPIQLMKAFASIGFDFHFELLRPLNFCKAQDGMSLKQWSHEQDECIVRLVNIMARSLHVPTKSIRPCDVSVSEAQLSHEENGCLHQIDIGTIRLRYALLVELNSLLLSVVPFIDLRWVHLPLSFAQTLSAGRAYFFYDLKREWFDGVINETFQRIDANGPEISLNPIATVGVGHAQSASSEFVQAMHQMFGIDPSLFRVKLASGGDPSFPVNVRLAGESVQGTSGSFREFMLRMVHDLQNPATGLLIECPSSALGSYKGRYVLKSGPLTWTMQQRLQFFGMLIGIALRADVPIALDMMPSFWKSLVGESITLEDLKQVDLGTHRFLEQIRSASVEELGELSIKYTYHSLDGSNLSALPASATITEVCDLPSRDAFVEAVQKLRLNEIVNAARIRAIRLGLSKVVPPELLTLMTSQV
jgi:hypothetical protein